MNTKSPSFRPTCESLEGRCVPSASAAAPAVPSPADLAAEAHGPAEPEAGCQMLKDFPPQTGSAGTYLRTFRSSGVDWLSSVYHDVLGRAPDAYGLNGWLGMLGSTEHAVPTGKSTP